MFDDGRDQRVSKPIARAFDPNRPWPTAPRESARTAWIIAMIAFCQFELNALQNLPEKPVMFWLWAFFGFFVGIATVRIEKFFDRRGRLR